MAIDLTGGYTYQCTKPELLAAAVNKLNAVAITDLSQYLWCIPTQYSIGNQTFCYTSQSQYDGRQFLNNNNGLSLQSLWEMSTRQVGGVVYKSPFLVCVETGKLSELKNINPNIYRYVYWGKSDISKDGYWDSTGGYLPSLHPNAIYIKNIYLFDNSNDGNYSASNVRTALSNGDVFTQIPINEIQNYRYGRPYGSALWGYHNILFSLRCNAQYATGAGMPHTTVIPYKTGATSTSQYTNVPVLSITEGGGMFNVVPVEGRDSNNAVVWAGSVFENENELKKMLNFFGMPYTLDLNYALNTNVSDLPDYDPEGVKPNPSGGGDGDGDNFSDDITFPDTPFSPATLGGVSTLVMTGAQLQEFTKIIWKPVTKSLVDVLQQYFNIQPLTDSVLSMMFYPFDIQAHDSANVTIDSTLAISWSDDMFSAGIMGGKYNRAFDMGSYTLNEYYGSYLDYSPYTTVDIWLPYIGYKSLDIDTVMSKTISVKYFVEFIDGSITAVIYADGQPINTYSGQMGINISVTGRDFAAKTRQTIDSVLSTVTGVNKSVNSVAQGVGAGLIGDVGAAGMASNNVTKNLAGAGVSLAASMIQQPTVTMYGTAAGENWLALPQYCHLKITRTVSATPNQYDNVIGYPSTYTAKVKDFGKGFVRARAVQGAITTDNADEFNQIVRLLQAGVFIG